MQTNEWGKVSCKGLVFINKNKAIVFDTPANEEATSELIRMIQDSLKTEIVGVVVNHFHEDRLAGLKVLHQLNIRSYASDKTIALAKAKQFGIPMQGFKTKLTLNVKGDKVENYYFGGGHTRDNIVSSIPSEKVLFGLLSEGFRYYKGEFSRCRYHTMEQHH